MINTYYNFLSIFVVKSSNDITSLQTRYDEIQMCSLEWLNVNLPCYNNLLMPIILKSLLRDLTLEFYKKNINKSHSVDEAINFLRVQLEVSKKLE